ncbi:hypothetical protein [Streptodolium elevatio]|uniref:Uncharacterized protein n=1 Tax=Streptodolium elevatio TaxID=3157996 RepID=A0ABV3DK11_9ACTN
MNYTLRSIEIVRDGDGMTYDVLEDGEHRGCVIDERHAGLARGGWAAWTPRNPGNGRRDGVVGFYATAEEAADAILDTWPAPAGPKGETEPRAQWRAIHLRALPAGRRRAVAAHAARLHTEGGRTPASCWKAAIDADWSAQLDASPVPSEDEFVRCVSVLGGDVHDAPREQAGDPHMLPICRTGDMTNRGTRYRETGGELTCQHCIAQRDRRAERRARRAA